MADSKFVVGRLVLRPEPGGGSKPAIEPINRWRGCAINNCRRQSAGTFQWDTDITVSLCQKHADHFKLEAVDG